MPIFRFLLLFISLILLFLNPASAKDDLGQGRLFLGSTKANPRELKDELTAQNLKNIDSIGQYGIEITFPTFEYLHLGLRYNHHYMSQDELVSDPLTNYNAQLSQDSMSGVARFTFYTSDFIHMDAFAAAGVSNTTYTEKVATQDIKLVKSATPILTAGASVAFGYKQYFLFFESGWESNKVTGFTRSGTPNNSIQTIDLSGTHFLIGFMFDGIPIYKK